MCRVKYNENQPTGMMSVHSIFIHRSDSLKFNFSKIGQDFILKVFVWKIQ
jgi:hypothetical protein